MERLDCTAKTSAVEQEGAVLRRCRLNVFFFWFDAQQVEIFTDERYPSTYVSCQQGTSSEIADNHIHQGARSVKTTNTTSLDRPLSCNGQRATKTLLRQPQITTDRHACQMSQTNHHQHYPSSYRQASNNGDL
ncbi:hypothetical protein EVAR_5063_1 [Eumeta japonica]|uniref:Uncharacterized protein n=1 Tax=Eumeta variegata TaxID=151549 RepID=A0A4C1SUV9_EUMVA|nr:hypothetical protein EVAR_5063_1 [Eumeta japonica]